MKKTFVINVEASGTPTVDDVTEVFEYVEAQSFTSWLKLTSVKEIKQQPPQCPHSCASCLEIERNSRLIDKVRADEERQP